MRGREGGRREAGEGKQRCGREGIRRASRGILATTCGAKSLSSFLCAMIRMKIIKITKETMKNKKEEVRSMKE